MRTSAQPCDCTACLTEGGPEGRVCSHEKPSAWGAFRACHPQSGMESVKGGHVLVLRRSVASAPAAFRGTAPGSCFPGCRWPRGEGVGLQLRWPGPRPACGEGHLPRGRAVFALRDSPARRKVRWGQCSLLPGSVTRALSSLHSLPSQARPWGK